MQKIIARMRGGLGNQLFILACVYNIKRLCNTELEIVLDTREYRTYKVRSFELFDLIQDPRLREYKDEVDQSTFYDCTRELYHIIQKFSKSYEPINKSLLNCGLVYSKRSAGGIEGTRFNSNVFVYGYFQDARMVAQVKHILNDKMRDFDCGINLHPDVKYIAISIRWGSDYIKQGWPICSKEYFENGVNEIVHEKYKNEKVCVLVFSDEIEKAKKLEFDVEKVFIEGLSAVQQLTLMKKCQDFVISNSSFSWWGAFLGASDNSIVIAPNIWYDTKELTENTLLTYENMRIRDMGWKK